MTVAELRKKLESLNDNDEIIIEKRSGGMGEDVTNFKITQVNSFSGEEEAAISGFLVINVTEDVKIIPFGD
jgi:hypothetical protein